MKSLCVVEAPDPAEKKLGKVGLRDFPKPEPGPEDVLIKVAYASICGSDSNILKGNVPVNLLESLKILLQFQGLQIGHEISGVIEEAGPVAQKMGFKPGDRVTANYNQYCNSCYYCRTGQENFCEHQTSHMDGMSEYVCWHMSQIYKVPDDVSLLDASQTEPLTIALNAVETGQVHLGSRVFVSGAGSIGLYCIQLAKLAGASMIVASDIVESKRELAKACGADFTVDPTSETWKEDALALTGGLGFSTVLESSGAAPAAEASIDLMSKGGHCVMFAMYKPTYELSVNPYQELYENSKTIHGMYTSADVFPRAIAMLKSMDFEKVIEDVIPYEDCEKAFDKVLSGNSTKIVLKFSDDK